MMPFLRRKGSDPFMVESTPRQRNALARRVRNEQERYAALPSFNPALMRQKEMGGVEMYAGLALPADPYVLDEGDYRFYALPCLETPKGLEAGVDLSITEKGTKEKSGADVGKRTFRIQIKDGEIQRGYVRESDGSVVAFGNDALGKAVRQYFTALYAPHLDQLPEGVRKHAGYYSEHKKEDPELLVNQLAQLFPNADPQGLEAIVAALDTGFDRLRKTTDTTFTGTVLDFIVNGQRVYGKISRDKDRLRKEAAYHEDAWEHPALRVITPKLAGLVETPDMAGLFTYGTENEGIVAKEDINAYMKLRKNAFKAYAQMAGRDVQELGNDPLLTDVFNRALAHASLWTYRGEGVYNAHKKPVVLPFEQVIETAHPTNGALKTLRGLERKYRTAERALDEAGPLLPIVLLHRDAREENIFPTYLNPNPRPTGDFGNVQPGEPIFDLSRIEVDPRNGNPVDAAVYVRPYLFFREFIEKEPLRQYQDTPTLERMTRLASFTDAVRTLGTKIPRRDAAATRYYSRLAEGKAAMVR